MRFLGNNFGIAISPHPRAMQCTYWLTLCPIDALRWAMKGIMKFAPPSPHRTTDPALHLHCRHQPEIRPF
jgi:hypothetical protein